MINDPISFSVDTSLLIKKARLTEVDKTGTDKYHKQLVITYSLHIHCNNKMQTDCLEKALQLNNIIFIIINKNLKFKKEVGIAIKVRKQVAS